MSTSIAIPALGVYRASADDALPLIHAERIEHFCRMAYRVPAIAILG
jgi:hypothetical protein